MSGTGAGEMLGNAMNPIILPMSILFYSACQPTFAGIPYMLFLLVGVYARTGIFSKIEADPEFNNHLEENGAVCTYQVPMFELPTTNIGVFVSIFSLMYVLLPMIVLSNYNPLIIVLLVCYTLTMLGLLQKCYIKKGILIADIFLGLGFAALSYAILLGVNRGMNTPDKNYLFIKAHPSNGETCSMASKQNFVCSVYKNGQLVSSTPNIPGMSTPTTAYA